MLFHKNDQKNDMGLCCLLVLLPPNCAVIIHYYHSTSLLYKKFLKDIFPYLEKTIRAQNNEKMKRQTARRAQ